MNKKSKNKQRVLDFLKGRDGATYADMHALGLHRSTLRRWVMELEQDGLVTRAVKNSRARAVFAAHCKTCNDIGFDSAYQENCPNCCNL